MINAVIYGFSTFEHKTYKIACLLSSIICEIAIYINFLLGYPILFSFILGALATEFVLLYALCARYGIRQFEFIIYVISTTIVVTIGWFVNSGISGSMVVLFLTK